MRHLSGSETQASRLADALDILAVSMRAAADARRSAQPDGEAFRRADARMGYLNELYVRLQRRMEIPAEIWQLRA